MKNLAALVLACLWLPLSAQSKLSVDITKEYQTIKGFGAFGGVKAYWEPPPFYTDPFIQYFLEDLGATIVRTNIPWDMEPSNDNTSALSLDLSKFNYKGSSTLAGQLPYYKALKEKGLKKLVATSWTPPVWMKLFDDPNRIPSECYNCNNCPIGDPRRTVCGGRLNPAYYYEFAEYLIAYVKILKQEAGVDLYAINLQNEPYFANPFESDVELPEEFAAILKIVGQRFRQEGLTTKLFGPEHMAEWSWGVQQNYVGAILAVPSVSPYLDIYAVHSYVDGVATDFGSASGWTALHENITQAYQKPLWMTETSGFEHTFQGTMDLAKAMYLALRFGHVSAWLYWAVSDEPSGTAIMVNGAPANLYYVSKQFYKYIRPGAVRIEAVAVDPEVLSLAFKNPTGGSMSIVMVNIGLAGKQIQLDIPVGPGTFTSYRTSSSENCVEVGSVTNSVALPAQSITTLVGFGLSGPSIDEIPDFFFTAGKDTTLEITMTGIEDGNGGLLNFDILSSNTSIAAVPTLHYTYPNKTGTLTLIPDTSVPGKTVITLTLSNQNSVNAGEFSFNSTTVSFSVEIVDAVTGLNENYGTSFHLYPNPADTGQLILEITDMLGSVSIDITDSKGEPVNYQTALMTEDQIVISTSGWSRGLYFVTVNTGKKIETQKIIIR